MKKNELQGVCNMHCTVDMRNANRNLVRKPEWMIQLEIP